MPSSPSTKKANAGPGYYDLIKEAVITLKERTGSSRHAIDKFVAAKKGANYSKSRLNIALKRGVESGKLVPVKGSFKLAAEEKVSPKKPVAKPAAEKAAAPAKKTKQPSKNTTTKTKKLTVKKVAKSAKKATKTSKKPIAKRISAKKVLAKKPKTTKKKVVKKSSAKKAKSTKK